jgi:SAM-dependent methyltransferase
MEKVRCRICGDGEAESLGQIPDSEEFAGQRISPAIKGGWLWRCKVCGSMFRYPTLSSNDYISLYKKTPSKVWEQGEVERNDFSTIYAFLKNHVGGSILDIGCYSGNFLAGLPDKFKKYGIEPSELASSSAISKGINMLGKTLDELDSTLTFDVVVSIDVIEHVLDVEKFLSQALAHVKEKGLLIISTGNPDCYFWKKVFKSKFWYNSFAEHVTFPSYYYFGEFSRRNGLQTPEQIRFRYTKLKLMTRLLMLLRFSFAYGAYKILGTVRRVIAGNAIIAFPFAHVSLIGVFTDHHVIILRKKELQW